MTPTTNEKFLAYLALFSGLTLSVVAEYYSILGLTAIFSAAVIPVIVMGVALGVGKITATLWLKQNWKIAPRTIRGYLGVAIVVLMLITSMGIFGFLSKAHSDQSLVSGDVQAKISIYDEKIKTAKDNIEANRKQLKQMDEAVDQVMARSSDEKGADKANSIRRSQQRDRATLAKDIEANQKLIAQLNDQAAPIRAEVRKVEAEVGPIKYIAAFVYGATDESILEKAVTWVIITLIIVFDPLAVILLLASQISFQNFRQRLTEVSIPQVTTPATVTNLEEIEPIEFIWKDNESTHTGFIAQEVASIFSEAVETVKEEEFTEDDYDNINNMLTDYKNEQAVEYHFLDEDSGEIDIAEPVMAEPTLTTSTSTVAVVKPLPEYVEYNGQRYNRRVALQAGYIQNEEQEQSNLWTSTVGNPITQEEYIKTVTEKKS